jgi:hypothetical protein
MLCRSPYAGSGRTHRMRGTAQEHPETQARVRKMRGGQFINWNTVLHLRQDRPPFIKYGTAQNRVIIGDRVIDPSSGSDQRNTHQSAQHTLAAAARCAIPLRNAPLLRPHPSKSRRKRIRAEVHLPARLPDNRESLADPVLLQQMTWLTYQPKLFRIHALHEP